MKLWSDQVEKLYNEAKDAGIVKPFVHDDGSPMTKEEMANALEWMAGAYRNFLKDKTVDDPGPEPEKPEEPVAEPTLTDITNPKEVERHEEYRRTMDKWQQEYLIPEYGVRYRLWREANNAYMRQVIKTNMRGEVDLSDTTELPLIPPVPCNNRSGCSPSAQVVGLPITVCATVGKVKSTVTGKLRLSFDVSEVLFEKVDLKP